MQLKRLAPVIDGHNDTLLTGLYLDNGRRRDFFARSELGHLDLPRAREGNLAGGFFAVCVPDDPAGRPPDLPEPAEGQKQVRLPLSTPVDLDYARRVTNDLTRILFRLEENSGGQVKVVRTADELGECLKNQLFAAILHYEGAEAISPDLGNLATLYDNGLRSIGIVWSRPNQFGYGVPFAFPSSPDIGPGLTPAGKKLVAACNELGIMVDLAHLNEAGFWDVVALSHAPLVATHCGVHAICPHSRNLTDAQLDAIGASGGVIGINFHVGFLRPDGQNDQETPASLIVDHIDYVVNRIGIDHVVIGSDFDGALIPSQVEDVTGLPIIFSILLDRGYDDQSIEKVANKNWLRVLGQTWKA